MVPPSTGLVLTIWDPTEEEDWPIWTPALASLSPSWSRWGFMFMVAELRREGTWQPCLPLIFFSLLKISVLWFGANSVEPGVWFGKWCGAVYGRFMGSAGVPRGTLSAEVEHQDVQVRGGDSTDASGFSEGLRAEFVQLLSGLHAE